MDEKDLDKMIQEIKMMPDAHLLTKLSLSYSLYCRAEERLIRDMAKENKQWFDLAFEEALMRMQKR